MRYRSFSSPIWRKGNMTETPMGVTGDVQTMAVAVPLDSPHKFVRVWWLTTPPHGEAPDGPPNRCFAKAD